MFSYSLFQTAGDNGTVSNGKTATHPSTTYYSALIKAMAEIAIQVNTTGGLNGTWTLWASEKVNPDISGDTDWVEVTTHADFTETNPTGGLKAALDCDSAGASTNCDTVVEATDGGTAGNSFTVEFVADGTGVGSLTEAAGVYTFHFQNNVTTVANFETAVAASSYLDVKTGGTGGNVLLAAQDVFGPKLLTGGTDVTTKWRFNTTTLRTGHLRLKYANTSGTGVLYAYATI